LFQFFFVHIARDVNKTTGHKAKAIALKGTAKARSRLRPRLDK